MVLLNKFTCFDPIFNNIMIYYNQNNDILHLFDIFYYIFIIYSYCKGKIYILRKCINMTKIVILYNIDYRKNIMYNFILG